MPNDNELAKRVAAAHKGALSKAMHHLAKAASFHAKGMACLQKAARCAVASSKSIGGLADLAKSATALKAEVADALNKGAMDLAGHLAQAHEHFSMATDHHDVAVSHLQKIADTWGIGSPENTNETSGSIADVPRGNMTEGDVPDYLADQPYDPANKGAVTRPAVYSQEMVDKLVDAATKAAAADARAAGLEKQIEIMGRMPGPRANIKLFAPEKVAFAGDLAPEERRSALDLMMKDVSISDPSDPDQAAAAASKVIGNMMKATWSGEYGFGKSPVLDPSFRGRGGRNRQA